MNSLAPAIDGGIAEQAAAGGSNPRRGLESREALQRQGPPDAGSASNLARRNEQLDEDAEAVPVAAGTSARMTEIQPPRVESGLEEESNDHPAGRAWIFRRGGAIRSKLR